MTFGTRAVLVSFVTTTMVACAQNPGARPSAPNAPNSPAAKGKNEVVLGPAAMRGGSSTRAAWIAYGVAKAARYDQQRPPPANESADDFHLELAAREAMSEFWAEQHDERNVDLDRQGEIWKAGFLPEFVITVHGRPGWTIPGATVAALRLEEFVAKFSGNYSTETAVAVRPASGKLFPDVPGADFPDPDQLPIVPASCGLALRERRAAWERWARMVPRLGGRPIRASSTQTFGGQILAIKRDTTGAPPDVTWVSERVGHIAMLDGFCAVEVKDWKTAVDMLGRAVTLEPAATGPRLELSGALAMSGRLEEALQHTDKVIAATDDACTLGRGWRKRGYILIEMEAFEAARAAYEKSLVVDPGNPIAISELKTIATAMARPGNWRTKPQPGQPSPVQVLTTTCREGKPANK